MIAKLVTTVNVINSSTSNSNSNSNRNSNSNSHSNSNSDSDSDNDSNSNPSIRLKIIMDTSFNFQAGVSNRIQNNVLWIPLFFFLNSDCVSKSAYPKKNGAYPKKRIQTYSIVSKRMQISVSKNPNVSKEMLPIVSNRIQKKRT